MPRNDQPKTKPKNHNVDIKRVAILFAGGPAPAANAVISTCAGSFIDNDVEVYGILHGYSNLVKFGPDHPMVEGEDYRELNSNSLRRTRNTQGIMLGTARTNPGKKITKPADLEDPNCNDQLKTVYEALCSMEIDALISIGGDDTLKTANKIMMYQETLEEGHRHIPVVHLPKTIDNDYRGIDFTFGFFTAVEFLASEIRNLLYDAEASRSYFLAECMGRSAGWLAYGAAIAGEASLVLSVEDITGDFAMEETVDGVTRRIMNLDVIIQRIVKGMLRREADGKEFGVIVLAEGLAEMLPAAELAGIPRDDHDHIAISQVDLGRKFAEKLSAEYKKQTGNNRKVTGIQLGYESRCAKPHAFDVMLGSQLGVGAYRALVEEKLDGVMVSVEGQLDLIYENFVDLVDQETLITVVRHIEPQCDFHRLARFLETKMSR